MGAEDHKSRDQLFLDKLEEIVLENLQNDQFGVEDLARAIGISRSQLHRRLRKLRQKSISQFVREIRLNQALLLLRKKTGTVSEIAYQVGFNNPSYFTTSFRNHFGYPPGEAALRAHTEFDPGESQMPSMRVSEDSTRTNKRQVLYAIVGGVLMLLLGGYFFLPFGSRVQAVPEDPDFQSSVAVMAFKDLSEANDQEFFVEGISEEIIHRLTKYKDLKVSGRTSSFFYKNRRTPLEQIGQELGVAYILEGSVRKSGNRFRITVQLVSVEDGSQVWSDSFDREIEDVLYTQDEIASIIAQRLNVTLLNEDVRLRKVNPEAYELYLKSKQALQYYEEESTMRADSLIRESIRLDSTYSPSWAVLASTLFHNTFFYNQLDHETGIELGMDAAVKAIKIDPENPNPYLNLAWFQWATLDANAAIASIDMGYELAPNDPIVVSNFGTFKIKTNQLQDAKNYLERAIDLNPKHSAAIYNLSYIDWYNGDLEDALSGIRLSFELGSSNFFKNYELARIYYHLGEYEKAMEYINKESNPYLQLLQQCGYAHATGNAEKATDLLKRVKEYPEDQYREAMPTSEQHYYEVAILCAYLGEVDDAFVYLDMAYEHISNFTDWLFVQPEFKKLKNDPRWDKLLMRLNEDFNYNFYPG